jgi:hypothetical protein
VDKRKEESKEKEDDGNRNHEEERRKLIEWSAGESVVRAFAGNNTLKDQGKYAEAILRTPDHYGGMVRGSGLQPFHA